MNKSWLCAVAAVSAFGLASIPALGGWTHRTPTLASEAKVGEAAPSWTLSDTKGASHSLSDYVGKFVVLEWTNHQCPYVQRHYRTGNMQKTQKFAIDHGAVWLSVVSSAPGSAGYVTAEEGQALLKSQHSLATAKLLDPEGTVGRAYNARTTPDLMIVDPKGVLIYSGGIDDKPNAEDSETPAAHNYVIAALEEALAGKPVTDPVTHPYGCGVKYRH